MGTLPSGVVRWLGERHGSVQVEGSVGGGCVNPSVRLRIEGGEAFLKYNPRTPAGMFAVEADGLRALGRAVDGALRIPQVLDVWDPEQRGEDAGMGCLLLEWLQPMQPAGDFAERLGRGLAELHRARDGGWGWERDGFIGPLPQSNQALGSWAEFWSERRLEPQLRRARDAGWRIGREREWDALWRRLPELLAPAEADGPSQLHGDLWSGNVLATAGASEAEPALVDPAAYRGHREIDLAMAELFGGFSHSFFASYREAWPQQPGYAPGRRAAYQLFYLLVHVNLFGAGYTTRTEQALHDALAA
jgi:protein-ribulosamine 3-kinase